MKYARGPKLNLSQGPVILSVALLMNIRSLLFPMHTINWNGLVHGRIKLLFDCLTCQGSATVTGTVSLGHYACMYLYAPWGEGRACVCMYICVYLCTM